VGIITVVESAALLLKDDSMALRFAIQAFNARGGVGKHCMKLTICDSQGNPNKEVDCARELVANGIVATLSDQTPFNGEGVNAVMEAAGIPRVGIGPSTQDLSSTVAFPLDAGAVGTTFMQVLGCTTSGAKKLAAIHVDVPAIAPLFTAMDTMLKAHGAELVAKLPVTAGTADFRQYTLQAKNAGATCAIVPLGQNELVQVLQAARDLGTDLRFSGSANAVNADDMKGFGAFARQISLNSAFPPANASQERWPILGDIINDLAPAGFTATTAKTTSIRSWLATYALVTIVETFGNPDVISAAAITEALERAKDVDMFGLIPAWTPSSHVDAGSLFVAVTQPWYYVSTYEPDGSVTVSDRRYNVVKELIGMTTYPQPPG
jgi:ABC-type branched-subunit amino acid transport system substrate-binding protein